MSLRKLLEEDPSVKWLNVSAQGMDSEHHILYNEGRAAMEKGDLVSAVEMLKRSAELYPHFKTYESIGECLLKQDKVMEAVLYLSAAAGLGNKQFRSYFLLAKALVELGEVDWARNKLEQALSLNSDYKAAKDLLSQISARASGRQDFNN
jgi:tetratricopeptide (TPR) repeat protein